MKDILLLLIITNIPFLNDFAESCLYFVIQCQRVVFEICEHGLRDCIHHNVEIFAELPKAKSKTLAYFW